MKQSEKMLIFALATLFHAARIAGATARSDDAAEWPREAESIGAAKEFMSAAETAGIVPDLPDDDAR